MNFAGKLDEATNRAFDERQIVGARVLVVKGGETVFDRTKGYLDREASTPLPENAIFRLASLTKPIVAATALAMVEKGILSLDGAVADWLPYFRPKLADGREPKITIHHLLTHTAGLSYAYPLATGREEVSAGLADNDLTLEQNFTGIARFPLKYEPGTRWEYSVAIDVLGAVIAAAHGGVPGDAVLHYVTGPLGMVDTRFHVTDTSRLATAYGPGIPPVRMTDPYKVTNGNDRLTFSPGRIFNPKAFQSGGAGMAGTAGDFIKFITVLERGGAPILSRAMMEKATSNRIGEVEREPGMKFCYFGALVEDEQLAVNHPYSTGSYEWGGIYGHSWFIDPVDKLAVAVMTNVAVDGGGPFFQTIREAIYANV
ncbi:MAG: serine hydrolase domain-containing protein [Devosia sp.]